MAREDDRIVAVPRQRGDDRASEIAGAAGDEDSHGVRPRLAQTIVISFRQMFKRQRTGSVVCASCGSLVGVNDDTCYSCGRRNPGLWGFGRALRDFGNDLGFITLVIYGCSACTSPHCCSRS